MVGPNVLGKGPVALGSRQAAVLYKWYSNRHRGDESWCEGMTTRPQCSTDLLAQEKYAVVEDPGVLTRVQSPQTKDQDHWGQGQGLSL